ncbi:hypothetical protein FNV62_00440 [Streptomyces sp. RLB3-17]|nr:hypothetical protein FNV58_01860 [Streptomyces sp. RLB1-9]QDO16801.1 hypothetical protein FNV65_00430 [Streptomyces sp. S1A1-8]QDO26924.1 hypothetical protein FNV63_00425 [Streptomyces sp. S1A1-3]QDO36964.1 hypothetical protein FNV62_00440 [Streptomyces sp. RLB3-17]
MPPASTGVQANVDKVQSVTGRRPAVRAWRAARFRTVVRPAYWRRPRASRRPSRAVAGAVWLPVTAPITASVMCRPPRQPRAPPA